MLKSLHLQAESFAGLSVRLLEGTQNDKICVVVALQLVALLALNYFLSSNLLTPVIGIKCQLYQMHTPSYFCLCNF